LCNPKGGNQHPSVFDARKTNKGNRDLERLPFIFKFILSFNRRLLRTVTRARTPLRRSLIVAKHLFIVLFNGAFMPLEIPRSRSQTIDLMDLLENGNSRINWKRRKNSRSSSLCRILILITWNKTKK